MRSIAAGDQRPVIGKADREELMKMTSRSLVVLMIGFVMASAVGGSELRLNNYYTDHMVLQSEKPVLVKGFADKGATVTVSFAGQTKTAKAEDGAWSVTLDPMPASDKPRNLTATSSIGNLKSEVKNLLVGDVLIFASQSSIDVSLGRNEDGKKAAQGYEPSALLRTVRITTIPAKDPQEDLDKKTVSGWAQVDKNSALTMSATAFYLARDLAKKVNVPLGIVDIDMGPHFGVSWLTKEALDAAQLRSDGGSDLGWFRKHMPEDLQKWALDEASGKQKNAKEAVRFSPLELPYYPSACYNAVTHPLRGIAVKGILLQLGNDYPLVAYANLQTKGKSTDREALSEAWAQSYLIIKQANRMTPCTLPLVPGDMRRAFGDKNLPIGWIMPPSTEYFDYAIHNREMRELQRRTAAAEGNIGLIMPGNEHILLSGQPADEKLLSARCMSWVLGALYNEKVVVSGPVFSSLKGDKGEAVISFKEGTAEGLKAEGKALEQFEVAGSNKTYVTCKARIEGSTVKLTQDGGGDILSVRYNWNGKPDQGLVNGAGLPAVPFNSEPDWQYCWWPPSPPVELPVEYLTTANKWPNRDVAIINGANVLKGGDSVPNPNHLGVTGINAAPFGPNLFVHFVDQGSPADGKVLFGDYIYGVNGEEFGVNADDKYRQFAAAITQAETKEAGGKLVLNIRRKGQDVSVELKLDMIGSFSSTTPYNCQKSEKIVDLAEKWIAQRHRPASGPAGNTGGPFHGDLFFLMASGKPEYQGLVRRAVYSMMTQINPANYNNGINFKMGYDVLFLGEYYHWTGDANVLPYLKAMADCIARNQIQPPGADPKKYAVATTDEQVGGFRTKFVPGIGRTDYGLMAAAGMPCVMGLELANEAGVDIDRQALKWGVDHFYKGRAEYGYVEYQYSNLQISAPKPFGPEDEAKGMMQNMNGKLGTAASLFCMIDGYDKATKICSHYCAYSFNRTRIGHGGMYFNNFWAPIGASLAGEKDFQHFMKGQTWWRELYRRQDGSFTQDGRGGGVGVAYGIHYVAHHKRLRMLGAPRSVFVKNPQEYLKPALEAHRRRDYVLAEQLVQKAIDQKTVTPEQEPVVKHFLESLHVLRKSVEHDLTYTEDMIKQGKYYYASLELPQLRGVVAADNPRLTAIAAALESPEGSERIKKNLKEIGSVRQDEPEKETKETSASEKKDDEEDAAELEKKADLMKKFDWVCLVSDANEPAQGKKSDAKARDNKAASWRMKILEAPTQAPEKWIEPQFDDSSWVETTLPMAWRVSHTALMRCKFKIDDKNAFDVMCLRAHLFQQQNVEIYLNGELMAKVDNITADVNELLTGYALRVARNGDNILAVRTQHLKRWGKVSKGTSGLEGVSVMLDAGKAVKK